MSWKYSSIESNKTIEYNSPSLLAGLEVQKRTQYGVTFLMRPWKNIFLSEEIFYMKYVFVCVNIHLLLSLSLFMFMDICMKVCTYVCMHVFTYACIYVLYTCSMHVPLCVCHVFYNVYAPICICYYLCMYY